MIFLIIFLMFLCNDTFVKGYFGTWDVLYEKCLSTKIDVQLNCTRQGRKEGNVLFNDTLNTLYLWLYGIGLMVKDHSDSERGNLLPPHGLLFPK